LAFALGACGASESTSPTTIPATQSPPVQSPLLTHEPTQVNLATTTAPTSSPAAPTSIPPPTNSVARSQPTAPASIPPSTKSVAASQPAAPTLIPPPTISVATSQPTAPAARPVDQELRFLALGDSYTIGESVAVSERWPVQLAQLIREQGIRIAEPEIVAETGWTAADLASGIDASGLKGTFDVVTLMIGVNNQFRHLDLREYRGEFLGLLDTAMALAGDEPAKVIVISIPDYGVTPFAAALDGDLIAREIDLFSAVNREEAIKAGVAYVDVTGISRRAKTDLSLVAVDGLHPSGKMYGLWAEVIHSEIVSLIDVIPSSN